MRNRNRRNRRRGKEVTIKTLYPIGGVMFIIGLAGMAEACTGQGSFMVGAVIFAVGFGICLANMKGEKRNNRW